MFACDLAGVLLEIGIFVSGLGFVVFKHESLGDWATGSISTFAFSVALQFGYFKC